MWLNAGKTCTIRMRRKRIPRGSTTVANCTRGGSQCFIDLQTIGRNC
jgi:hypothetical protein